MSNNITVSESFLDAHLPSGNAAYIIVYLALLRHSGKEPLTASILADYLNMTESDILRAVNYWVKTGAIHLTDASGGSFCVSFNVPAADEGASHECFTDINITERSMPAKVIAERCPLYKSEEIDYYIKTSEPLRKLFKNCEEYLGKLLTYNDLCVIFGLHDWLRMPIDVIDMLISYCASNDRRSMRYIEKTAVIWTDAGINTRAKAEARIKMYNGDFREIMKELGKSHRDPVKKEEEYMIKWLKTFNMPLEVILAACSKTMIQAPRPGFKYADGILERWHKANVISLEDIEKSDEQYKKSAENTHDKQPAGKPAKKRTKFANFTERDDIDFKKQQELEMALVHMELGL